MRRSHVHQLQLVIPPYFFVVYPHGDCCHGVEMTLIFYLRLMCDCFLCFHQIHCFPLQNGMSSFALNGSFESSSCSLRYVSAS